MKYFFCGNWGEGSWGPTVATIIPDGAERWCD